MAGDAPDQLLFAECASKPVQVRLRVLLRQMLLSLLEFGFQVPQGVEQQGFRSQPVHLHRCIRHMAALRGLSEITFVAGENW